MRLGDRGVLGKKVLKYVLVGSFQCKDFQEEYS